jgi:hypothetical protein
VDRFDLSIDSKLSDTLQSIYQEFLNEEVEKISIIILKKRYDRSAHYFFLKNKKFYQSNKKWIKNNSYEESIIWEGDPYPFPQHVDSFIFEYEFRGVDNEFIGSEVFLDSTEIKPALREMFNGVENDIIEMCYMPRHAILFYSSDGKISGIYEICFQCSKVKVGIVGTAMFNKSSPYLRDLVEKYKAEL